LNFHSDFSSYIPPRQVLAVVEKLKQTYKLWQDFMMDFPKTSRYTLGEKIDSLFLDILELSFTANFLPKNQKLPYVIKSSSKLDLLRFFLQISWEIKSLDNKKYIVLSEKLNEIGGMFGNWIKSLSR